MATDEHLAETGGSGPRGGLMAVADGVESYPVRVRRAHCGSSLSIDLVEPIQQPSGRGEAR